jgi:hypothetical protein
VVQGRRPNIVRRQEAARLRRLGLSLPEIGRRLGITKQAVHQLLTPRHRSDARQLTEALILQLADEYHTATGGNQLIPYLTCAWCRQMMEWNCLRLPLPDGLYHAVQILSPGTVGFYPH